MQSPPLRVPYLFWAHTKSARSPYCLSQSGMPLPDQAWLGDLSTLDVLSHPSIEALPALERRLAELFDVSPERVLVTAGASGAMLLAALRWFGPSARVAVETPAYQSLAAVTERAGASRVPIERRPENGWQPDPGQVESALDGARPGHVFLTNPHNPTGAVSDAAMVQELAAVAGRADGILLSCEVYMEYATNEQRVHAARLAPNAVSIGSLTKAYGLGPLRVGWMILGEGLVDQRESLIDAAYLNYVDMPTVSLSLARRVLDDLPRFLGPLRRVEAESRPLFVEWLRTCPSIEAFEPEFGIYAFPRIRGVDDTQRLAEHLALSCGVDVVPGEFFGRPGHLRVGCGVPVATLQEGLARLTKGLAEYIPGA
ncbi:MAG: aspartate/methionine/tyrosine aminotransferase [Chlamydiales bacterium]|jgi:aspartate/methionine/tyrosine aminotransferase